MDLPLIREAFSRALEAGNNEREVVLASLPADVRREVESLLDAHRSSGTFLSDAKTDSLAGEQIGPYRLIECVGQGGMGLVYRAQRDDGEFHRTVAIKLVGPALFAPEIERRFIAERRILSLLDHPNIVRMIDGGIWCRQRYLVMEFVSGVPIDEYCRSHALGLRQRLSLFLEVCAALAHAHSRLVVHRDIKPSNVLVTSDGHAKVLDFGVARLLENNDATASPPMTLAWASPEQVLGHNVSTAADIYSLGMLLFALLAGRLPYSPDRQPPGNLLHAICDADPVWDPPGLIRGDLRSILAQALQKDPDHRYSSVEQLAADVQRYSQGRPVRARSNGLLYRARKFVVRRAIPLAAASVVVIAIVASAVTAISEGQRAERRFAQVRSLAHYLIFDVYESMSRLDGSLGARRDLARRTQEYLERFGSDTGKDRTLVLELAEAYLRLGDVRGGAYMPNLGDTSGALESYRSAVALLEREAARAPVDDTIRNRLAAAYLSVARILLRQNSTREALNEISRGMALAKDLHVRNPTHASTAEMLSRAYAYEGELQCLDGRLSRSVALAKRCLANYKTAVAIQEAAPDHAGTYWRAALGANYFRVSYALTLLGDLTANRQHYCDAVTAQERGWALHASAGSASSRSIRDRLLADDLMTIAATRAQCGRDPGSALRDAQTALQRFVSLAEADPENVEIRRDVANAHVNIATVLVEAGRRDSALDEYGTALSMYEALGRIDPHSAENEASVAITRQRIAALMPSVSNAKLSH